MAAVAALIKSILPQATPAQIRSYLVSTIRPYPAGSACNPGGAYAGLCGAGMLDAERALLAVPDALPFAVAGSDQVVVPGTAVALDGGSSRALSGKTLIAYEWLQTAGTPTSPSRPERGHDDIYCAGQRTPTFRLRHRQPVEDGRRFRHGAGQQSAGAAAPPAAQNACWRRCVVHGVGFGC
jgi:hypothetical protein